ncbi:DUF1576 domain-containing protein [Clostridium sp. MCC353]|uniref:DUF1576 domain-containing protein n=1 Tax=Clostridium sp. MCC353 TaxID=2592646 RepID=UPI001C021A7D|nr:DUF1576 domain-containing protein [Clostridium sp. MCC353]MBT9778862.1 DUF1576 domain-containing protein [Clostridium sp. MCC353]
MLRIVERIRHTGQPYTNKQKFMVLGLLPTFFMIAGLFLQPPASIVEGIITIIREPDFLITDYIAIGGVGAALINASLLTYMCIGIVYFLGMEMDGHTITSSFLMFGFSLFGKNILNIWTILLGIWVYSKYHKTSVTRYIYIGFYGTSLSPIITQVMQIWDLPVSVRLLLSLFVGVSIGFLLPPLSTHVYYTHKGYSLYNVGFSSGIIATVIISLFKSFGIKTESRLIWATGYNELFIVLLTIFFMGLIIAAVASSPHVFERYRHILSTYGLGGTDYVKSEGLAPVLMNMGINGLFATAFVAMIGGDLNGPTLGGIFTIVGFSATGKHLRNIVPIMMGVWLASFLKTWNITDPSPMLALLFSTTLAPIAGEFGVFAGLLAGFLHSSMALNVGSVYAGMNLYNNGFAGGILAAFMVPVILSIRDRKARAKGNISL